MTPRRLAARIARRLLGRGAAPSSAPRERTSKFPLGRRTIERIATTEPTGDLAIVTIVRDEGPHLAEWLAFQRLVGAQRVYVYDNRSEDSTREVLAPFEAEGFVEVIDWPISYSRSGHPIRQLTAYLHALEGFGHRWRWMAFLDADEFLFPAEDADLPTLLQGHRDLPALVAFWRMFGTPEGSRAGAGLVTERCTRMAPFPTWANTKTIVQPRHVRGVSSVHILDTTAGHRSAYDELGRPFVWGCPEPHRWPPGVPGPHTAERLLLNHYVARSPEDDARRERALEQEQRPDRVAARHELLEVVDRETVEDLAIQRYVPALRAALDAG